MRVEPGMYRHTKTGRTYEVIGTAFQTETEELLVVYRPLYETEYELFDRPLEMFCGQVVIDGIERQRFEKIS